MELAFYFSGLVAVLATLRVITHTKPVHALLYLIISLLAIACVFFSLGAYFAGVLEIIIYAGAIMVLFVFVMMMFNTGNGRDKQECSWFRIGIWIWPSLMVMLVLLAVLVRALIGAGDHGIARGVIAAKTVGITLFGPYVLAVELASMLLLAGLVVVYHLGRDERNHIDAFYKKKPNYTKRKGGEQS